MARPGIGVGQCDQVGAGCRCCQVHGEQLLRDPHEQFDKRSELLVSILEYLSAPSGTANVVSTSHGSARTKPHNIIVRAGLKEQPDYRAFAKALLSLTPEQLAKLQRGESARND
jgi:hypothetical protein